MRVIKATTDNKIYVPEEYGEFVEFFDVDAQCHYMTALLNME